MALTSVRDAAAPPPSPAPVAIWVTLRVRHLQILLALSVAAFAAAGAAVAFIAALTGADYMMGFKRLLDLNVERNLPTWFSSTILLVAAALLAGIAVDRQRPHRGAWTFLAIVFVLLSLDEMASLHEMSNAPLRALLHAGPALYFPWIIGGLVFAAAVFAVEWRLLWDLPRRTALLFVAAGAIYVSGAIGFEAVAAPLYARHVHPVAQAALVTAEESFEMIGVALFIVALARYWKAAHVVLAFAFDPRRVVRLMVAVSIGLAAINVGLQLVHFLTPLQMPRLVRLFDLAREGNVPTWYQSYTLLGCGALAALIAFAEWQHRSAFRVHWALTALFCVYMSADEAASIHEMTVSPLRNAFHTTGLLYYPWIVLGATAVIALAIVSRRFLQSMPRRTRRTLVVAAIVFLTGALGFEALGGMYAETHGRRNLGYGGLTTVEETLEMLGIALAAFGLVEYLRDHVGRVRVSIGA